MFQTVDEFDGFRTGRRSLEESKKQLASLQGDDDESSLSEADSDDFEDVLPAKRRKLDPAGRGDDDDDDNGDGEDGMDWEDAIPESDPAAVGSSHPPVSRSAAEIGDISISINDTGEYIEPTVSAGVNKKGPSKRERLFRLQSHRLHVMALLWHNTVRNSWLNDKEIQTALVDGLTGGVKQEVMRWKESMGTLSKEELLARKKEAAARNKGSKGKRKGKEKSTGRDWNVDALHLDQGVPDLSRGDPLLRLLKVLLSYWRKRFTVTAPGLRKQGYKPLRRLGAEIKDWQKQHIDPEEHGERIESKQQFLKLAIACEGSRDVGAQLFVAMLRGLGIEARMVANLQPIGFGWSKAEEADPKRPKKSIPMSEEAKTPQSSKLGKKDVKVDIPVKKSKRKSTRGEQANPVNLDESDSPLSELDSEPDIKIDKEDDDDDLSVVDVTPSIPRKRASKKYDNDLAFPNYWIEACSAVSNKIIPCDPIVLSTIGSNDDLIQSFEPRGKIGSKQVICYAVAHSSDGTAKDVTIRYLRRHQLPGKTKGVRLPVEKIPVYDRNGKIKKHENYDWFREVLSSYDRPEKRRTAADDLEDQSDLQPFKPAKDTKEVEKESLQWYKQSAEFVLEQHLRREEALLPHAEPVKTFTAGKGEKVKEHPVFRRKDVVTCKTVESWHKDGRELKVGQHPMKLVPMRAVTLIRKREMEEVLKETGEKQQQGLYSKNQTDWIIPPPIENGVIPRNAFGNIDIYVPTMVPKGAVHLPLKGSAKLCRKLEIDFAEAVTGFAFGKQRAVPVLTGVVVAEEHEMLVRDAWKAEQKEIKRKEDIKRVGTSLTTWRKMLLALRVLDRIRGSGSDETDPFAARAQPAGGASAAAEVDDDDMGGGGFFRPGYNEEEVPQQRSKAARHTDDGVEGGGFLDGDGEEEEDDENGYADPAGGLLVEDNAVQDSAPSSITPFSQHQADQDSGDDNEDDSPVSSVIGSPSPPPSSAKGKMMKNNASPKVIISSAQISRQQLRGKIERVTPRKSQYFASQSDSEQEDARGEENEEDSDGEEEIVQPRRTTARTRTKH